MLLPPNHIVGLLLLPAVLFLSQLAFSNDTVMSHLLVVPMLKNKYFTGTWFPAMLIFSAC